MNNVLKLLVEMAVVGAMLVVVGLVVGYVIEIARKGSFSIDYYPSHFWGMVGGLFAAGAVLHFLCEVTGLNAYYVRNYRRLL